MSVKLVNDDWSEKLPEVDHIILGDPNVYKEQGGYDAFAKPAAELRTLDGLTPVFKRKVTNDLRKFHRGVDSESKKIEIDEISGYNLFQAVTPPYNLDYLARLYEINPAHYAAVNAKVANIVGLGYKFVETSKVKRALEDITDEAKLAKVRKKIMRAREDLTDLFDTFNEDDTFTEVLIKVWRDYEVTGNGYIEVGRKRDGTIGYIGHISSPTVRLRQKRDGFVQIISNKAVFFRNFGDGNRNRPDYKKNPPIADPFGGDGNPNELIHFKKYSPTSTFYGVPDIIAAKQAVAGMEFAARFNLDYFENKAVPRHVIILKGARLSARAEAKLTQFFETGLKGKNHRSLYIPLPGDSVDEKVELKIEPVEAGIQDASFEKYDKGNINKILMPHRVPITKISVADAASLAIAKDADKTFKEQVCSPEQGIAEKKINKLVKELTDAFLIDLNEMTLTDAETQSKIDERDVKHGIKNINEIRADRGMPGIEGGDKPSALTQAATETAQLRADGNRTRDGERSANATDSSGAARNPKGDGRTTQ